MERVTVLMVGGDDGLRDAIDRVMQSVGAQLLHADNSRQAVDIFRHQRIDALLIDLRSSMSASAIEPMRALCANDPVASFGASSQQPADTVFVPLCGNFREIERRVILEAIRRYDGNKAAAARSLGLHRRTLYRILDSPARRSPPVTRPAGATGTS
jgi:DNA-binding NtrC family response regulator